MYVCAGGGGGRDCVTEKKIFKDKREKDILEIFLK